MFYPVFNTDLGVVWRGCICGLRGRAGGTACAGIGLAVGGVLAKGTCGLGADAAAGEADAFLESFDAGVVPVLPRLVGGLGVWLGDGGAGAGVPTPTMTPPELSPNMPVPEELGLVVEEVLPGVPLLVMLAP